MTQLKIFFLRSRLTDSVGFAIMNNRHTNGLIQLYCDCNVTGIGEYDHGKMIDLFYEIEEQSGPVLTITMLV